MAPIGILMELFRMQMNTKKWIIRT